MMHGWGTGMGAIGGVFSVVLIAVAVLGGVYALSYVMKRRGAGDRADGPGHDSARRDGESSQTVAVFRLARRSDGILTVSDLVSELAIPPSDAEHLLDTLARDGRVEAHVEDDGVVRYIFREMRVGRIDADPPTHH